MSWPATLTLVTVSVQLDNPPDGGSDGGTVLFTLPYPLLGGADDSIVPARTERLDLDANGAGTIQLPATDDPQWSPVGWAYAVELRPAGGVPITGTLQLTHVNATAKLAPLLQVDGAAATGVSYLLTSQRGIAGGVAALDADGDVTNADGDKLSGGGGGTSSSTVVAETSYGQAATAGVATSYSRGDHTHGTPALPTAAQVSADTSGFAVMGGATVQESLSSTDAALLNARSTGVRFGGALTDLGGGIVRIAAGEGGILDNSDPSDPTYTAVSWAQTDLDLSGTPTAVYYVSVSAAGAVTFSLDEPSHSDYRLRIHLHRVSIRGSVYSASTPIVQPLQQYGPQIWDTLRALGSVKTGLALSPAGTDLTLALSAGEVYAAGANFYTDPTSPHEVEYDARSPVTFRHVLRDGTQSADATALDVDAYDASGTLTAIPGAGTRATIFTVKMFPSGNVRIFYGQTFHASVQAAQEALFGGTHTLVAPATYDEAITIGWVIAEKAAANLADGTQVLISANRFGLAGGAQSTSGLGALLAVNNLSDVDNASTARTNLGLGAAATLSVGTTAGTVAAGDDSRITGAQQRSTLTTKGDLYVATGAGTVTRIGVGTDGQVLSADSGEASGVAWSTPAGGGGGVTVAHGYVTSGNITPQDTSGAWQLLTGSPSFVIAAAEGDEIRFDWTALTARDLTTFYDLAVVVSAAGVLYASSGAGTPAVEGDPGFYPDIPSFPGHQGTWSFTAASGHISGGNITIQFAVKSAGSGTLYASTSFPLRYTVTNYGQ